MPPNISRKTAQQIVDTVRDVCGYNINFILPDGTIAASTNPDRIGTYHEIGHQAAVNGQMLEVGADDAFYGTQKGVNLPFSWQGEIIAVIGITGDPAEVRKYAYLAQRITRLILRERELDQRARTESEQISYVVHALLNGENIPRRLWEEFLKQYRIDPKARYRTVLIQLENRYNPANLSMIEQHIIRIFNQTGSPLHTFEYPDRYILIETDEAFNRWGYQLKKLASDYGVILKIGVGDRHRLVHQNRSRREAEIAVNSVKEENYAEYSRLKLEVLLGSVPEDSKELFRKKTTGNLDEKEKRILRVYFECECHLKQASEKLYIHINTLQYQLDKISGKTGLNPRKFEDAVVLYLALKV